MDCLVLVKESGNKLAFERPRVLAMIAAATRNDAAYTRRIVKSVNGQASKMWLLPRMDDVHIAIATCAFLFEIGNAEWPDCWKENLRSGK
jgi:hypothetical protein